MKKKKKSKNIYDNAITYENIYSMWNIVRRTCKNKREVFYFSLNLHSNLMNIYNVLKNRTYTPGKYRTFMIFEPKPRLVMSQSIFDKIINYFVANFYLLPYLENSLTDCSVATRSGKGSSYAMKLIKKYVNEIVINEHPEEIYCLKIDISKYFYTINHNILINKLEMALLDKDVILLIKKILDETNRDYINENIKCYNSKYNTDIPLYLNNRGVSIGAMTSQFLAIFFLNDLTHFIIEKLNCKYLVVYMDDILILSTNKEKLKNVWYIINEKIVELNLKVNKKSNLYRLTKGINFLGFHYQYKNYKLNIAYKKKTYYKIQKRLQYLAKNDLFKYKKSIASYYGYFKVVRQLRRDDFGMKNIEVYDNYKNKYLDTLIIVKEGIFYSTYRSDADIIWYLFSYKHLDNKVSFGQNSFDKVIYELKEKNISFCVVDKEREYFNFVGDGDIYNSFKNIAVKSYDKKIKEDILINKLKKVLNNNPSKYDEIMDYFNTFKEIGNVL